MQICKFCSLGNLFPCLLLFLQMWVEQILEIGGEANIWLFVPPTTIMWRALQWTNFLQTTLTKIIQGFLRGMVETHPVILSTLQSAKGMWFKTCHIRTARQETDKGRFHEQDKYTGWFFYCSALKKTK